MSPKRGILLFVFLNFIAPVPAQVHHFEFADLPRLVDCKGQPCFRLLLNALDAQGQPASIGMSLEQARERFRVVEGALQHRVFHIRWGEAQGAAASRGNYSMLLVDYSGSMNGMLPGGETMFVAAKRAVLRYLDNFQEGTDHVAVVPFESHRVVSRIQNATFHSSPDDVRRELDALSRPATTNNTALYTAVYEALSVLESRRKEGYQVSLVVLTDGRNDVKPPPVDDPRLLGNADRHRVEERARETGIEITTIGFGKKGGVLDEDSLRALAWPSASNYYYAGDRGRLEEVFGTAREKLIRRIQLTLGPVRQDKSQLAGQTITLNVFLDTLDGQKIASPGTVWVSPALGSPSYEADLDPEELSDLSKLPPEVNRGNRVLWRLLILAVFGGGLATLWFGFPRLIWPERYIPRPSLMTSQYGLRTPVRPGGIPPLPQAPRARDPKVTIPPRAETRPPAPAAPPRPQPRPAPPRTASDETIFQPSDPKYPKDE